MKRSWNVVGGLSVLFVSTALGCGGYDEMEQSKPGETRLTEAASLAGKADEAREAVPGARSEALASGLYPGVGVFDIGVIPAGTTCPAGSIPTQIYMDDEDNRNANQVSGWIGATSQGRNTTFLFCRVDGTLFKALSSVNNPINHYAVLKLGTQCPEGATEFSRGFDNEDDRNANWASGYIGMNVSNRNTVLYFCLFRYAQSTMGSFPNLDIQYGVFAASNFARAVQTGWIYTDDEDDKNKNQYSVPLDAATDAQRIVSSGRNTTLHVARVR